ncbi:hypothetical protein C5C99_01410 [Rathayibacter sp. AY1C4]|uniref:hypothetical protein n=1 Tax=Rathayibacter sp. AY1C4 TaxID=2080537 RepID=UPI000CE7E477|nr:hypothetical protein [Rathayibacter sp. AY1C4]PPH23320.1 hypothetical protein C5C99_01410 [Rathayibacter sp. AY1C4]
MSGLLYSAFALFVGAGMTGTEYNEDMWKLYIAARRARDGDPLTIADMTIAGDNLDPSSAAVLPILTDVIAAAGFAPTAWHPHDGGFGMVVTRRRNVPPHWADPADPLALRRQLVDLDGLDKRGVPVTFARTLVHSGASCEGNQFEVAVERTDFVRDGVWTIGVPDLWVDIGCDSMPRDVAVQFVSALSEAVGVMRLAEGGEA